MAEASCGLGVVVFVGMSRVARIAKSPTRQFLETHQNCLFTLGSVQVVALSDWLDNQDFCGGNHVLIGRLLTCLHLVLNTEYHNTNSVSVNVITCEPIPFRVGHQ